MSRSWLFFSILESDFINAARKTGCDVAIIDLEDSVLPKRKKEAREHIGTIQLVDFPCKTGIRINNIATEHGMPDLIEVLKADFNFIVHPKTINAEEINVIEETIRSHGKQGSCQIVPIIETFKGLENATEIFKASGLISHVIFGSIDYLADLGLLDVNSFLSENLLLQEASVQLSLLSLRNNIAFIDCTSDFYASHGGADKFRNECYFSKSIGAKGKVAIHPNHVNIINEVFDSTDSIDQFISELEDILMIMAQQSRAVISYNKRIIGPPYLKNAIKKLEQFTEKIPTRKLEFSKIKDEIIKNIN